MIAAQRKTGFRFGVARAANGGFGVCWEILSKKLLQVQPRDRFVDSKWIDLFGVFLFFRRRCVLTFFETSVFLSHGSVEKDSQDLSSSPPKRIADRWQERCFILRWRNSPLRWRCQLSLQRNWRDLDQENCWPVRQEQGGGNWSSDSPFWHRSGRGGKKRWSNDERWSNFWSI